MNKHVQSIKAYVASPSGKDLLIGVAVVAGFVALIATVVLVIQANMPKIVYQPTVACDLLTEQTAKEVLGEEVLHRTPQNPVLTGHVVTTKCSYTDKNPEQDSMMVAALAIRSGADDKGVAQNKAEFAVGKAGQGNERVEGIGDSAYFNPDRGQLNILKGGDWMIISFGAGAKPTENTLENATELAQKLLQTTTLPTF